MSFIRKPYSRLKKTSNEQYMLAGSCVAATVDLLYAMQANLAKTQRQKIRKS
jgi:hypothetical protein